ncbi:MAG: hypothetical protein MJ089_00980 [Ruminococcus sp.]|nr:hypothetical protein [Ruminococcus sp.]
MSKKKLYVKRTVKILSLILFISVVSILLQNYILLHYDHNTLRFDGFYLEDENSIDVALVGASELYADYSAVLAYEKFGYTSYSLATPASPITVYKTEIQEILRTQNPKLIVVEINGALYGNDEHIEKEANIRNTIDNIPFNENKKQFISQYISTDDRSGYYFPLLKYHSAWNDYPQAFKFVAGIYSQHKRGFTYIKGFKTKTNIYKCDEKNYNDKLANDDSRKNLTEKSEKALRELLEYCQDNELNVLFVRIPHIVLDDGYTRFKRANTAGDIINEYGYDYLNFERYNQDIGLDINNDFYNADHMNIYGAEKFTEYFGNILVKDYNIKQLKHTTEQTEKWDKCVEYNHKFLKYCDNLIKNNKEEEVQEDYQTLKEIDKYCSDN